MNDISADLVPILVRNALRKQRIANEIQQESDRVMTYIMENNIQNGTPGLHTLLSIRDHLMSMADYLEDDIDYAKALC